MHRHLGNEHRWFKNGRLLRVSCLFVLISLFWANLSPTSLLYAQETPNGDTTQQVFLPFVADGAPSVILTPEESAVESLLHTYPGQQHPNLVLNEVLTQEARRKAEDMAKRSYFGHTDPEGFGPNHWVKAEGYTLPPYYDSSPSGNNIESIAAGQVTAADAWDGWMHSNGHRSHLLGEVDFYREQIDYGIGYYHDDNSPYHNYWVVLIAKPNQN